MCIYDVPLKPYPYAKTVTKGSEYAAAVTDALAVAKRRGAKG